MRSQARRINDSTPVVQSATSKWTCCLLRNREPDSEGRSYSGSGVDAHGGTHALGNAVDYSQAQACPLTWLPGGEEWLEDLLQRRRAHTIAGILDAQLQARREGSRCHIFFRNRARTQ